MVESGFGFCIFDPEGDYAELANSVCVGDAKTPPVIDEALDLVRKAAANVVINTQALSLADRPVCFNKVMPRLLSLRAANGRPHWILVDEAHHQMGASRNDFDDLLPKRVRSIVLSRSIRKRCPRTYCDRWRRSSLSAIPPPKRLQRSAGQSASTSLLTCRRSGPMKSCFGSGARAGLSP